MALKTFKGILCFSESKAKRYTLTRTPYCKFLPGHLFYVSSQQLYNVESEIEESLYDSVGSSSSGASSDEWEDDSDSWETDHGFLTEDADSPLGAEAIERLKNQTAASEPTTQAEVEDAEPGASAAALGVSGLVAKVNEKEGIVKSFKELKEAIKILESLKNMTVEQLLTGSPTSPIAEPEKFTREKKFLDDIKKLQENLKKTLDNVAIAEEEKMESAPDADKEDKEAQTPVRSEWPSDTPVLCQQCGGKPGVIFTSAKGEVFSVLDTAPGKCFCCWVFCTYILEPYCDLYFTLLVKVNVNPKAPCTLA